MFFQLSTFQSLSPPLSLSLSPSPSLSLSFSTHRPALPRPRGDCIYCGNRARESEREGGGEERQHAGSMLSLLASHCVDGAPPSVQASPRTTEPLLRNTPDQIREKPRLYKLLLMT
ncbi:unnamed protein product [Gadus morhua 'NCC']